MKKYKAIIYDIDGTVLDTLKMNMVPLKKIIEEELGQTWTYQEVLKYASYPGMKVMEELQIENKEEVYTRWVEYVNNYPDKAQIYPGMLEVFQALQGNVVQAVMTSKKRAQYQIDMVEQGYDDYISVSIVSEDTKLHKPDPQPILACIQALGLPKEEVIYIGDAYSDYLCCHKAGVDFGLALWGAIDKEGMEDSTYLLENPTDILNIF
ncbi:HAD family hydrolase [Tannockella kyphosi]|uniref:HAD family hydrolase n=1 Tax=Tannockella kyphosi TaxID=2899121 RepID=UPI002010D471|nr:HAD-IA family hydrolase [Tannockella kyphosi]